MHPYDWTYTPTDYRGSLFGDIKVSDTEQKIDYEKLKVREKILFFDEVILYEDELDDNGCAVLTTKVVRKVTQYKVYEVLITLLR